MSRAAELRAVELLLSTPAVPVVRVGTLRFSVASSRGGPKRYVVDIGRADRPNCTCAWFRWKGEPDGRPCKHIEAARLAIRVRGGLGVPLSA